MKQIFEKNETLFCILLILLYVIINSYCMQNFGLTDYRSAIINTIFSIFLIVLMIILKRTKYYGLTKVRNSKKYLLINVGFIEEIIFRGFLFKMMEKDNIKSAIIVGAFTFGIGHIINLFNGADIIPTLMQVCYATAIGYLFVMIFYKSKSLIPCIITHSITNSLAIFKAENTILTYIVPIFLIIISVCYAIYINKIVKD